MKKSLALGATALSAFGLAFALTAAAQHGPGDRDGHRGHKGKMIEKVDTNQDGNISKAEVEAAKTARFNAADTNRDGNLTLQEMISHREAEEARRKAEMQQERFNMLDTDGNGTISATEFDAHSRFDFDKVDTNNDGVITQAEREAMRGERGGRRGHHGKRGSRGWRGGE